MSKHQKLYIPLLELKGTAKSVNFGTKSVTFRGSLFWNKLFLRPKNSKRIDDFKSELKNLGKIHCTCVVSDLLFLHFIRYRFSDGYFFFNLLQHLFVVFIPRYT